MKIPNFDKQAAKFLVIPVKKLKNINVIDITDHNVPYQLENESRRLLNSGLSGPGPRAFSGPFFYLLLHNFAE